jgi:16S rRNA (guanine527-N7)-methyltransferase
MDIQKEIDSYNVSRETSQKIADFIALLQKWNEKMNLVSKNSLSEVWVRHVLDSMQLIKHINPTDKTIVDIGSGSGFPGIVLAVLLQEKQPNTKVFLIESITKKTMYLNAVRSALRLDNVCVLNERVENAVFKDVDVVTARAVAALDKLLGYCYHLTGKKTKMLLFKGKSYEQEEAEARKKWQYDMTVYPNIYHEDGVVLEICNLRNKK